MWELRWVLLGLGALLVVGIYVWGRTPIAAGACRLWRWLADRSPIGRERALPPGDIAAAVRGSRRGEEPSIGSVDGDAIIDGSEMRGRAEPSLTEEVDHEVKVAAEPQLAPRESLSPDAPERVIALRFVAGTDGVNCQKAILALRSVGLEHGRYGIFHRVARTGSGEPLFSVANLTEPGSFDLKNAIENSLPGMTFFMVLPGQGDPVERFDDMVQTARDLARELGADLFDDRGSSWSVQRERYIREEVIQYRHQHGFARLSQ